jgi:hypothetical protein
MTFDAREIPDRRMPESRTRSHRACTRPWRIHACHLAWDALTQGLVDRAPRDCGWLCARYEQHDGFQCAVATGGCARRPGVYQRGVRSDEPGCAEAGCLLWPLIASAAASPSTNCCRSRSTNIGSSMSSAMIFQLAGEMAGCRLFRSLFAFRRTRLRHPGPRPQDGWATHAPAREDSPARSAVP